MFPELISRLGLIFLAIFPIFIQGQVPFHSTHAEQAAFYGELGLESEEDWDGYHGIRQLPPRAGSRSACTLQKSVYGWHPYWMGSAYTSYDFSLMSTFSYFSYEVNPSTGNYNSIHSWKTTNSVTMAQAAGCKVELCATLFGGTNNATFLGNMTARQTFIDSIIALVQFRNADGVNIDFEGIPGSQRGNFTSFMQDLSSQLKTAIPGATLTMALYSVDWNNVFDIAALDPYLDEFIIMGYGYYYSGSANAGPTAPLYSGSRWWAFNLTRTVLYYLGEGVTPEKLLIGLPYYGNEYNTVDNSIPGSSQGFLGSRTYSYARTNYEGTYTKTWDPHGMNAAYIYQSGTQWRQAWVEDNKSLGEKFDLAWHKNIGGIGIWALGYDGSYPDLWNLLEEKFTDCGYYCTDTLYDTGGPLGNYRNNEDYTFRVQSPSGEKVEAWFPEFDVELNWDYLYVYDGPSTAAPLIGTYTGNVAPPRIAASGDALTFRFTSDGATVTPGFALAWECVPEPVYTDTIYLDRTDSAEINCSLSHHVFYDSETGPSGDYNNNESHRMTFCHPDSGKAVLLNFRMQTAPVQLDLRSTVNGNDYLRFYDGADNSAPLLGVYTGSTNSYPQPGTVLSSGQCLTVEFESDASGTGDGWEAYIRCADPPNVLASTAVSSGSPLLFEDNGGSLANYGNGESWIRTFCPDAGAQSLGEGVWAVFDSVEIEQNYDYLHVYDGPDRSSRLIATYTGNDQNWNQLFTIKATEENPSGCLTFEFFSDGATNFGGWAALMTTGKRRKAYGRDACSGATLLNEADVPYAGSTTLAHGAPNAEDPPLNIFLSSLPECSGSNTITRLENGIWYRFTTPSTICTSSQINLELENISCQNSIPGGNGAQFVLYEVNSCQTGSAWGTPIYCTDKLLDQQPVNVAALLQPSQTYYVLIDGFAGQHCNLDLKLTGDINGCILPIELVAFAGEWEGTQVRLHWETAFEQNNQGFWVQRMSEGEFVDLGFVPSAAAQGGSASYSWLDDGLTAGESRWYRLRQVDLDGVSHYHRILEMRASGEELLQIYPNPTNGGFWVESSFVEGGTWSLFDLNGREVRSQSLAPGGQKLWLERAGLPAGLYLYRYQTGSRQLSGKLLLD